MCNSDDDLLSRNRYKYKLVLELEYLISREGQKQTLLDADIPGIRPSFNKVFYAGLIEGGSVFVIDRLRSDDLYYHSLRLEMLHPTPSTSQYGFYDLISY